MRKNGIGVVIGRFQTDGLHGGHMAVLNAAYEHENMIILVGVCASLGTRNDPLDFPSRKIMLQQVFRNATILPLPNQPTNEGWSKLIDSSISQCFPLSDATLYFGRDSAIESYTGKFDKAGVNEVPDLSAEDVRAHVSGHVGSTHDWRQGVIYSVHNQYPIVLPVVDVCVTRPGQSEARDKHSDYANIEVLVGKRNNEGGKHRFPGGHVGIDDDSYEHAARREVHEETNGCETSDYRVLGSLSVKSKYNAADRSMMSTVFRCTYMFGAAKGTDDLDGLEWVHVADLDDLEWVDSHEDIAHMLLHDVEEERRRDEGK